MTSDHEISTRELRANLADVIHRASVLRETIYITQRGRRVAVIGPVIQGEQERGD